MSSTRRSSRRSSSKPINSKNIDEEEKTDKPTKMDVPLVLESNSIVEEKDKEIDDKSMDQNVDGEKLDKILSSVEGETKSTNGEESHYEEDEEPPNKIIKKDMNESEAKEEVKTNMDIELEEGPKLEEVVQEQKEVVINTELEKFWKAVKDDPSDFTGWTYLLQYVDSSGSAEEGREAYNDFLFRYPYCYGYWKKYADFEKKKGNIEKCMLVFERGIKAISLSAELWIHYLNHVREQYADQPEFIRAQYERAVDACGLEWRSDKLWDHYVKWELEAKEFTRVLKLYDIILRNPTQGISHQFEMFCGFVNKHAPKDFMPVIDFLNMRKEVLPFLQSASKSSKISDDRVRDEDKPEEAPPGEDDDNTNTEEENTAIREKVIASRRKIWKETEKAIQPRWKFEENIRRPYFHMKPLERNQLKNWSEYLDFEIANDKKRKKAEPETDSKPLEILFERCLIACALYEEFWLKYINWAEAEKPNPERIPFVRDVYTRVCLHHLPNKVKINVNWAAFEEGSQNLDKACEILRDLEAKHPKLLSLKLRRVNLERRRNNIDSVHSLYNACIQEALEPLKSDIVIKYARFLRLSLNDVERAAKLIEDSLSTSVSTPKEDKMSLAKGKLYLQLMDIYSAPLKVDKMVEIMTRVVNDVGGIDLKQRVAFSQRRLEFLEDFGLDVRAQVGAQAEHDHLSRQLQATMTPSTAGIRTIATDNSPNRSNRNTGPVYPTVNSASYGAHHTSQYQQYGARYNHHQYGSGGSNYYQGYHGGSYSGY